MRYALLKKIKNHSIFKNALSLYFVQFVMVVIPLVLVPYLARVLRPEGWGLIVFTQSFALWLQLIMEFGFNFSATREISQEKNNFENLQNIVSGVVGAKLFLAVITLILSVTAMFTVQIFVLHPLFAFLAFWFAVAQSATPFWYFQGVERVFKPALINVIMRMAGVVAIVLIVKSPDDSWKVLALQAFFSSVGALITLVIMFREVPFNPVNFPLIFNALSMGKSMFYFNIISSLYTTANSFLLGVLTTVQQVGLYGGAERIHRMSVTIFGPISQAFYPFMVRVLCEDQVKAKKIVRVLLVAMFLTGVLLSGIIYQFSPWLVDMILGKEYGEAIVLLRVFILQIPLTAISRVLGLQWLLPHGRDFLFNCIVSAGAVTNLSLIFLFTPEYGATAVVWSFVLAEAFITFLMIVSVQYLDKLFFDPWG